MKPNLFIIGAAKCGTTSLHAWLSEHPQVFMTRIKEPNYFCSDLSAFSFVKDWRSYQSLYQYARENHVIRGESSVNYMISKVAAGKIFALDPDARLIAMIRNPADLVYSYHSQLLRSPLEDETDFEVAWSLSEARQRGQGVPKTCPVPALVDYREIGRLGSQLWRFLSLFDRSRLHIVVLDDLVERPQVVYGRILDFLGIQDEGRCTFPRLNENLQFKWGWARRIVASSFIRRAQEMGIRNTGLQKPLYRLAAVSTPRPPLRPEFREHLTQVFRPEVEILQELTGRDLREWL